MLAKPHYIMLLCLSPIPGHTYPSLNRSRLPTFAAAEIRPIREYGRALELRARIDSLLSKVALALAGGVSLVERTYLLLAGGVSLVERTYLLYKESDPNLIQVILRRSR